MQSGIRLAGRGRSRHPLGRQIRHERQLHRRAGGRLRAKPPRRHGRSWPPPSPAPPLWRKGQGLRLFLWDAYRPQRAVDRFLAWCAAPEDGRTKQKHYPNIAKGDIVPLGYVAARSGHSRGSTVDLTLARPDGSLLEMGGGFDLMDAISHHGAPVDGMAARNRLRLRAIMEKSGFAPYENEWWHYTLRDEPYPRYVFRLFAGMRMA